MRVITTIIIGAVLLSASAAAAQTAGAPAGGAPTLPQITIGVGPVSGTDQLSTGLKLMLLVTVLTVVPSFLVMMTSFTRIVVVLSFMRQALGSATTPTNQIILGLALFLTIFIMFPVWQRMHDDAFEPYMNNQIGYEEAYHKAMAPLREFMLKQTRDKDLALFLKISKQPKPQTVADVPTVAIVPAFVVSELKTAFTIGFLIWLPFLIVDMVIASVLMSMGMLMLPPVMISMPFKLLIFVLADGWTLLVGGLVNSFIT
jgi:flagellar biosynthetic protein FliP